MANEAGCRVAALDGRDLAPSPEAVLDGLRSSGLHVPDDGPITARTVASSCSSTPTSS